MALFAVGHLVGLWVGVAMGVGALIAWIWGVPFYSGLAATAGDLFPRLPVRHLVKDRWDSARIAPDITADVLVLRAGRDELVRPPRTDALLKVLRPDTHVIDFPDAGHSDLSEDPAYWRAIEQFLA